jgi:prepilin signal peptidase PulO-like enzyme (type II secretory pathway)
MEHLPQVVGILFSGIVGLLLGSFATMVHYRMPRNEDMIFKRSHCIVCAQPLGVLNLIPFFSWMVQRGKCSYCQGSIHWRYPLIEATMALLCIASYLHAGWSVQLPLLFGIVLCIIIICAIDLEYYVIPDGVQLVLGILAILYQYTKGQPWGEIGQGALLGLLTGVLLRYGYYFIRRKEGLGLGDVKFLLIAGIFLDPYSFVLFLFYSGVVGTLSGIVWCRYTKEQLFPFAPALCVALLLCLLAPEIMVLAVYEGINDIIRHFML